MRFGGQSDLCVIVQHSPFILADFLLVDESSVGGKVLNVDVVFYQIANDFEMRGGVGEVVFRALDVFGVETDRGFLSAT